MGNKQLKGEDSQGTSKLNIENKDANNAFLIIKEFLKIFHDHDIQEKERTQGFKRSKQKNLSDVENQKQRVTQQKTVIPGHASLRDANPALVYALLNMTLDEFHKSYTSFFEEFDNDSNFKMEESEFASMVNFFAKKKNVGKKKLVQIFRRLVDKVQYIKATQMDELFESVDNETIGPNIIKLVFERVKYEMGIKTKGPPFVDYLKMLPILLPLYSEFLKKKIHSRNENIILLKGVDERGIPFNLSGTSLRDKFESLGYRYSNDPADKELLSYSTVEKVLILFRNSYMSSFGPNQLNMLLKEVKQEYGFHDLTRSFEKKVYFDDSLLKFLSYRICLHSACYYQYQKAEKNEIDKFKLVEEYTFWSAPLNMSRITPNNLRLEFMEHLAEDPDIAGSSSEIHIMAAKQTVHDFFKKIIPQIPKSSINRMIDKYINESGAEGTDPNLPPDMEYRDDVVDLNQLAENLYELLIFEAESKLFEYIEANYANYVKTDDDFKRGGSRHSSRKMDRQDSFKSHRKNASSGGGAKSGGSQGSNTPKLYGVIPFFKLKAVRDWNEELNVAREKRREKSVNDEISKQVMQQRKSLKPQKTRREDDDFLNRSGGSGVMDFVRQQSRQTEQLPSSFKRASKRSTAFNFKQSIAESHQDTPKNSERSPKKAGMQSPTGPDTMANFTEAFNAKSKMKQGTEGSRIEEAEFGESMRSDLDMRKSQRNTNVLNACFIMETFIQKSFFLNERTGTMRVPPSRKTLQAIGGFADESQEESMLKEIEAEQVANQEPNFFEEEIMNDGMGNKMDPVSNNTFNELKLEKGPSQISAGSPSMSLKKKKSKAGTVLDDVHVKTFKKEKSLSMVQVTDELGYKSFEESDIKFVRPKNFEGPGKRDGCDKICEAKCNIF